MKTVNAARGLVECCRNLCSVDDIKLLIDSGADVHVEDEAPLRWASLNGCAEVVKLLLEAGADVHAYNDEALRWASEVGSVGVVKLLLEAGSKVDALNDYPIRWAFRKNHIAVVKLLLENGADWRSVDVYFASKKEFLKYLEICAL